MAKTSLIVFTVLLISQLNVIQFVMGAPASDDAATTVAPTAGASPSAVTPPALFGLSNLSNLLPANNSNSLSLLVPTSLPKTAATASENVHKQIDIVGAIGTVVPSSIPPVGQLPTGQPPLGQFPTVQPLSGQLPLGQLPTGQLPLGPIPIGQLPLGQQPAAQPATIQTPAAAT